MAVQLHSCTIPCDLNDLIGMLAFQRMLTNLIGVSPGVSLEAKGQLVRLAENQPRGGCACVILHEVIKGSCQETCQATQGSRGAIPYTAKGIYVLPVKSSPLQSPHYVQ